MKRSEDITLKLLTTASQIKTEIGIEDGTVSKTFRALDDRVGALEIASTNLAQQLGVVSLSPALGGPNERKPAVGIQGLEVAELQSCRGRHLQPETIGVFSRAAERTSSRSRGASTHCQGRIVSDAEIIALAQGCAWRRSRSESRGRAQ